MIKTRAKDLRGVAASSRIAEAIIAFACAQNRLPALIPLSSNRYEEVGWFLFIWAAPWLKLAVYNWWRVVIKSCLGLDTQPARPTKPKPTNCSHQSPSTLHLPLYNPTNKIPIAFYPLWDRLLFTSAKQIFAKLFIYRLVKLIIISSHCYGMAWQHLMNLFMVGRFSETIWSPDTWNRTNIFWRWKNPQIISCAGHTHCKQICLAQNVAWRLIAFHRVKYSTLLYDISFLSGYRNIDNIDN